MLCKIFLLYILERNGFFKSDRALPLAGSINLDTPFGSDLQLSKDELFQKSQCSFKL
jgi:hypothetical protein